jgi:hypothetical protein
MPVQSVLKGVAYKYDMLLNVDGIERVGMLVAPRLKSHSVSIKAQGDLDLLAVESCHREIDTENAGTSSFFGIIKNRREFSFTYTPSPLIETTGACPVRINGFTQEENGQSDGQSSWGFIDFDDGDVGDATVFPGDAPAHLPALMQCDGAPPYKSNGVTVCQSKQGTLQRISFPSRVIVAPDPGCEIPANAFSDDGKSILFPIARGFCVYRFGEVVPKEKRRYHRLTTYGFEQILLHGGG